MDWWCNGIHVIDTDDMVVLEALMVVDIVQVVKVVEVMGVGVVVEMVVECETAGQMQEVL